MKRVFTLCLALVMVLSLAACGSPSVGTPDASAPTSPASAPTDGTDAPAPGENVGIKKIAVSYAGSLGDKTYNDTLHAAITDLSQKYGFTFDYAEPIDPAQYEPVLRGFADAGDYQLIVCLGFSQGSSMEAVAPNYPDQKFVLIDATVEGMDNVACYSWRENEVSYLVGIMAGYLTKTKTIGFIGAFDIYNCNMNAAGFIAGAQSVDPEIKLLVDYVGDWYDSVRCKEMALAMNQQGADVLYHAASTAGLGVLEAGKDGGFYTIGFDGNVNAAAPATNFASSLRLLGKAVEHSIEGILTDNFESGVISLGASDDAIDVTTEGSTVELSDEILNAVEAARKGISEGSIKVPLTLDELEASKAS